MYIRKPRPCRTLLMEHIKKKMPTAQKNLSTFGTFCFVRVLIVQTKVYFAHFHQVQVRMASRHSFTVPIHSVKFLCPTTFHWGLKVATHCCVLTLAKLHVVVLRSFIKFNKAPTN